MVQAAKANGSASDEVALFRHLPALRGAVPWARLGQWPTPVEPLALGAARDGSGDLWVKREDLSSPIYGGNKIRTLEAMMGHARAAGAERIWATGAYGSNHAVATVLHAHRAGLAGGAALFPQPPTGPARANLCAALSVRPALVRMATVAELPFAMAAIRRRARRRGEPCFVMTPGGATPEGAFGALSAALELAEQVETGAMPAPARIVLAVGSTCTTAGLLAGLHVAATLGLGFGRGKARVPAVTAVRVTPWPVTSRHRVAHLAHKTVALLERRLGRDLDIPAGLLLASLHVEERYFGGGYGVPTASGVRAIAAFANHGAPPLDIVYSAKSGAAFLDLASRPGPRPLLFWATKSSAPLPSAGPVELAAAPRALRRWLA